MFIGSAYLLYVSIFLALEFTLIRSAAIKNIDIDSSEDVQLPANRLKPDLGCILFGNAGCQITCNVMCDLYGCQTEAQCVYELYCDCQETYDVLSTETTVTDYSNLSFTKLWNYKFEKSKTSNNLRTRIINDSDTYDEIIDLLRNPHKTGIDIKKHLLKLHPKWKKIWQLKPKAHGHIFDMVTESEEFDNDDIKKYIDTDMEPLIDQMFEKLQKIKYKLRLAKVFDNTDEDEIKYIIEQILLARKDSLYDYASNYLQKKGLQVDDLIQSNTDSISTDDIDQLILASVVQRLLEVKEQSQLDGNGGFALSDEMDINDDLYDSDFSDELSNNLKKRKRSKSRKTIDELKLETYSFSVENDRIDESYDIDAAISENENIIQESNQQIKTQSSNNYVGSDIATNNGQYYGLYGPPMGSYPPHPPPPPHVYYPPPPPPQGAYSYPPPPPPPGAYSYPPPPPPVPSAYPYSYPPPPYPDTEYGQDHSSSKNQGILSRWLSSWGSVGSDETTDYQQSADSNQGYNFWNSGSDQTNYNYNNDGWWSESESCCGGYTQNWDLGNSGVTLADDSYGDSVQSWDLGRSGVTIGSGASGNNEMQWKLGKSSITLKDDGRGNTMQSWDLGNSGVNLQESTNSKCSFCG